VFNFTRETYAKFPYLPMHSLVWAKEQFDHISFGFMHDLELYQKGPKQFIQKCQQSMQDDMVIKVRKS
jgi:hypothetical protein